MYEVLSGTSFFCYNQAMTRKDVETRLSELGIYNQYYYRKELKLLGNILNIDETLNCVFTGLNSGMRRLVAITDFRIIIIGSPSLGTPEIKYVRRKGIKSYNFSKKFFVSKVVFSTDESTFEFNQVQRAICKLFNWAMEQPVKEYDE